MGVSSAALPTDGCSADRGCAAAAQSREESHPDALQGPSASQPFRQPSASRALSASSSGTLWHGPMRLIA
eukprot:scaffold100874_cov84-Phaeocystis_antarctica.AAC.1